MRSSWLPLVALAVAGCAISLDDAADPPATDAGVPTLPSCAALHDGRVVGALGRIHSWLRDDGQRLLLADTLALTDRAQDGALFVAQPGGCLASVPDPAPASAAVDVTPLGNGLTGQLLDSFVAAGRRFAYLKVSAILNPQGVALATWDDARQVFVAAPGYLFTADRPSYGDAVLVVGDQIYAYGCRGTGFLTDSCYLARVSAARAGDASAYEFYRGGAEFGPGIDGAWPLFTGGSGLAVVARGARVYAVYVTPLGDTLTVRSGLGPSGPWSAAYPVARCELPAGGYCGGVSAFPDLSADPAVLPVSYGIASFDPLTNAQRATRFVTLPLADLP